MRQRKWILGLLVIWIIVLAGVFAWIVKKQFDTEKRSGAEISSDQDLGAADRDRLDRDLVKETEAFLGTEASGPLQAEDYSEDGAIALLFGGDVLLSEHVTNAYKRAGGIQGVVDDYLRAEISRADIFMVNQEFPFSGRGKAAEDKQFTFRLSPEYVNMMNEMEIDIVTLANNHALDYGTDALLDTFSTLDNAGIRYVGAGGDLDRAKQLETMEVKGKTIGFLAASRVIPEHSWNAGSDKPGMLTTYDSKILVEEIKKAGEICDYLVVYVHWGIERNTEPEEYQHTLGKEYIDAGADIVVGSHPHVLQGIEYYNGKPIIYSLGNFVFGSSIPKTALLKVELEEDGPVLSLIPATSASGFTTMLTNPAQIQEFYQYMTGLSFGVTMNETGRIIKQ